MLSYCRGPEHPIYNRTYESFESRELPQIVGSSQVLSAVRRKPPENWKPNVPSQHVEVPVDCFLLYTTLPDSKLVHRSDKKKH